MPLIDCGPSQRLTVGAGRAFVAYRRARGAMTVNGLGLADRIQDHTGKVENARQVSGTTNPSQTQLGLVRNYLNFGSKLFT